MRGNPARNNGLPPSPLHPHGETCSLSVLSPQTNQTYLISLITSSEPSDTNTSSGGIGTFYKSVSLGRIKDMDNWSELFLPLTPANDQILIKIIEPSDLSVNWCNKISYQI